MGEMERDWVECTTGVARGHSLLHSLGFLRGGGGGEDAEMHLHMTRSLAHHPTLSLTLSLTHTHTRCSTCCTEEGTIALHTRTLGAPACRVCVCHVRMCVCDALVCVRAVARACARNGLVGLDQWYTVCERECV